MLKSNFFEHLRHEGEVDESDIRFYPIKSVSIFDNRIEQVEILTSCIAGKFIGGYKIRFASGRESNQLPTLETGWFDTESNAILYYLGYFKTYGNYFTADAFDEINRLIPKYSQTKVLYPQ